MLYLLLLLYCVSPSLSIDCSTAPTEALRTVCRQLSMWDEGARKTPITNGIKPPAIAGFKALAAEFAPIASNMYQCMTIECLCVFYRGSGGSNCVVNGVPLRRAVRKEYRMLTDNERYRFHTAMQTIKQNGEYERMARIHAQFATSGGAHSGPAFLPWHREYMKRVEIALRQVDPTVTLPYWDSTLEQNLQTPTDSALWSNDFMGETDRSGNVVTGPFRNFRTLENRPSIRRAVGAQAKLFSEDEIQSVMNSGDVAQVLAFTAPRPGCPYPPNFRVLEYTHGNPHIYVGGDMLTQATAANDPIFYLHHSFVDLLWEMWRLSRQSRAGRESQYPQDNSACSSEHHFSNSFMRPFPPLRNTDGLSNMYTDNLYTYAARPSCSMGANCGSKYLFCDRSHGPAKCAAKMKNGAICNRYVNGEDVCYNGRCVNGRCVAGAAPVTRPPPVVRPNPTPVQTSCFNEHECCQYWSGIGECNRNYIYMSEWCKASCSQCRAPYNLNAACEDRHPTCSSWARSGECTKNPLWMSENCRRACNKCGVTRAQKCGGGAAQPRRATTASPIRKPPVRVVSNDATTCPDNLCYNEDVCCPVWASQGACSTNQKYMKCNCKVSCRTCTPEYPYGSCFDYHSRCPEWSFDGQCTINKWMLENCRESCSSCMDNESLYARCSRQFRKRSFWNAIM